MKTDRANPEAHRHEPVHDNTLDPSVEELSPGRNRISGQVNLHRDDLTNLLKNSVVH
jgi:hypothetical protein